MISYEGRTASEDEYGERPRETSGIVCKSHIQRILGALKS
jgi:hypothetical protein